MPNVSIKKANFTAGELSPTLHDRSDIAQYQHGAAKLRNVLCLPHGGVERRPGLAKQFRVEYQEYIPFNISTPTTVFDYSPLDVLSTHAAADLYVVQLDVSTDVALTVLELTTDYTVDTGAKTLTLSVSVSDAVLFVVSKRSENSLPIGAAGVGNSFGRVNMFEFEFSTEENYLFVYTVFSLNIYRKVSGVYAHQVMVNVPYYQVALQTLSQIQQLDSALTMSPFHPPTLIQRQGSHTAWAVSDWPLVNVPQYDYEDSSSPSSAVNHQERINYINFANTNVYKLFVDGEETDEIEYFETDSTNVTALETAIEALDSVSTGDVTVTIDTTSSFTITMGGASAGRKWTFEVSEADHDSANNDIRMTTKTKGQGDVEDVWSSVRGWPVTGSFFQSRLWFAGSHSRPQSVWASRSLNLFDFNTARTLADYGIDYTANTDKVSAFFSMQAGRHLQFFSSSAEFYVPVSAESVITPENFVLRRTSQRGAKEGSRVFDIDGSSYFVQRHGKSIQEFIFSDTIQAYQPSDKSNLASHLLDEPRYMSYRESISTDEPDYLYVVNEGDGTLAVLNTLRTEDINAWSLIVTEGLFRNTAVVDTDSLFAIERTINTGSGDKQEVFVEMFDPALMVDSGSSGGADSSTTDLDHLGGQTVAILQDGNVQAQQTLASSSSPGLTFARSSDTDWQAGLPFPDVSETGAGFETMVQLLPFEPSQDQSVRGNEISMQNIVLELFETSHIEAGIVGFEQFSVSVQGFGSVLLDTSIPVFTGVKSSLDGLQNFSEQASILITQSQPLPMTLLGVTLKGSF